MSCSYVVAFDVSKKKHDAVLTSSGEVLQEQTIANRPKDIAQFVNKLAKKHQFTPENVVFCMEYTGIYCNHLLAELGKLGFPISMINASEIKLSLGVQRGKDDKVDARRIAEYAHRFSDRLRTHQPVRPVIQELKDLISDRELAVKTRTQISQKLNEKAAFMDTQKAARQRQFHEPMLTGIQTTLKRIEQQIKQLVKSDPKLKRLVQLITSIPGIGFITAINIIARTNEFEDFDDPKKFACYAGVAPFKCQSGSSLNKRDRISHKAYKPMKTLLHLCAMAAVNAQGDLQDYYHRKLEEKGNKMLVLNAVRNKLISRIFAVVRNNTMYDRNYQYNLQKT
jgi:transposase